MENIKEINIKEIYVPHELNLRMRHDEAGVSELMESIRADGQLQPIIVKSNISNELKQKGFNYEIVVGFRRHEAIKKLGYFSILAIIKEIKNLKEQFFINLAENIARKNLTTEEEGFAFIKLHNDYDMEYSEIAVRTGKTISHIKNCLSCAQQTPKEIRPFIAQSDKLINRSNKNERIAPSTNTLIARARQGSGIVRCITQNERDILYTYAKKDGFTREHVAHAIKLIRKDGYDAKDACLTIKNGHMMNIPISFKTKKIKTDAKKLGIPICELIYRIIEGELRGNYPIFRMKEK